MAANSLLALLLSLLTIKTGFSAEISVFVKTGDSVQLDIQTRELPQFDVLTWKNHTSENIVKYVNGKDVKLFPSYEDRVSFNDQTFSLTLMNMQKKDSGVYTAKITGDSEEIVARYRISVIDAVEAPVLTVNSISSSSDSCTVNFTCRGHDDLMINNSYLNNRCSSEEVTSHEYSLIIHCTEESIICNYSNPVSLEKAVLKNLCVKKEKNQTGGWSSLLWLPVVLVLAILILFWIAFYCHKKKKGAQMSATVYDEVQTQELQRTNSDGHTYDVPQQVQVQTQEESKDNRPSTTYCTVGQHQIHETKAEDHTIYSTVCKQTPKKQPDD